MWFFLCLLTVFGITVVWSGWPPRGGHPGLILGLHPGNQRPVSHCNNISHWLGTNLESDLPLLTSEGRIRTMNPVNSLHCQKDLLSQKGPSQAKYGVHTHDKSQSWHILCFYHSLLSLCCVHAFSDRTIIIESMVLHIQCSLSTAHQLQYNTALTHSMNWGCNVTSLSQTRLTSLFHTQRAHIYLKALYSTKVENIYIYIWISLQISDFSIITYCWSNITLVVP